VSKKVSVGADAHIGPIWNVSNSPNIMKIRTFYHWGDVGIAPYARLFQ